MLVLQRLMSDFCRTGVGARSGTGPKGAMHSGGDKVLLRKFFEEMIDLLCC